VRGFKFLYNSVNILLLAAQFGFLGILVYNKMAIGRVLYYGNIDEPNTGFEKYFFLLKTLLYGSLILMIAWAFLTPLAIYLNKQSREKDKMDIYLGSVGFVTAIVLLITDPFGIFKWFTG
jgi:hypothetical protein